jgi:hypothetical protein
MKMAKAKSGLAAKLGAAGRKAHSVHKDDETIVGTNNQDLPKIDSGVAELTGITFDKFKNGDLKGEYFFMASGTIVSPKTVKDGDGNVIKVQGRRTSIGPEPLCDTPNRKRSTFEQHYEWVLNELRKLGLDTSDIDFEDLEDACEALVEEAPRFNFHTWISAKTEQYDSRTWENWDGLSDSEDEEEEEEIEEDEEEEEDDSEEEEEAEDDGDLDSLLSLAEDDDEDAQERLLAIAEENNVQGAEDMDEWSDVVFAIREATEDVEEEEEEEDEEEDEEVSLGELADSEDEEAIEEIEGLAAEAGLDPDDYPTYVELEAALNEEESEDEEEEEEDEEESDEEEEEEIVPEKEEVYFYKPPRKRKFVECEVTSVNKRSKTCTLINLDDETEYKDVSWDSLSNEG